MGGVRLRGKFRELYFDKDDEKIWKESIVVLDKNVEDESDLIVAHKILDF
ncbi:hypothetical protein [Bacillus safensis]|nr:hypothetical protein [Bacillus safensis]MCY7470691.1 hypothetical protein [Bacillus safensis]MCY7474201.1 hypothetical protein [Bacillus safensis]